MGDLLTSYIQYKTNLTRNHNNPTLPILRLKIDETIALFYTVIIYIYDILIVIFSMSKRFELKYHI